MDFELASSSVVTISGTKKNDNLFGDDDDNLMRGGAGNDYIYGGKGNDTLIGGAGNDTFAVVSGKDIIKDYTVGADKLYFTDYYGYKNASVATDGKDVIFYINSTSVLIVKNAKGKKITVTDEHYGTTKQVYGNKNISVVDGDGSALRLDYAINKDISKVDASKRTKPLFVVGSSYNHTIIGGKANDTVEIGKGNSYITGGAGKDEFVFSGGYCTIGDY